MAFIDAFPGGRVPVLAPLKWTADGWLVLQISDNTWGKSYPYPLPSHALKPLTGVDRSRGSRLSPEWEWNHNPDNSKWLHHGGLILKSATVTGDLYKARNRLTHRILGPESTATIVLNYSGMKDGDRAGLVILRDSSAWVGVEKDNGSSKVAMEDNLTMNRRWQTTSTGTEVKSHPVSGGRIWLRVSADIHPGPGRTAQFSYSTDGRTFRPIGTPFVLDTDWQFFMGYRYAIFNYATKSLGGEVRISSFTLTAP